MKKSKFSLFKEKIKNPPLDRMAAIEYRSHFLQMFGIIVVCLILILKGFWYIIFAFIFGVGISYTQGVSAYNKYRMLNSLKPKEKPDQFELDISPSRRRSKIIKYVMGSKALIISSILSVVAAVFIINPQLSRLPLTVAYIAFIPSAYLFFYFFMFYWISYPIYKKRMKGGLDGKKSKKSKKG